MMYDVVNMMRHNLYANGVAPFGNIGITKATAQVAAYWSRYKEVLREMLQNTPPWRPNKVWA